MKKLHLFLIVAMAAAVGLLVYALGDASSYVSFAEASRHPDKEFHVVGRLAEGHSVYYNPSEDPNRTEFFLTDHEGKTVKVIYPQPKPADFERAEEVVIIGRMQGDGVFLASKVLTKCPSKYVEKDLNAVTSQSDE